MIIPLPNSDIIHHEEHEGREDKEKPFVLFVVNNNKIAQVDDIEIKQIKPGLIKIQQGKKKCKRIFS
ncbi:MAG: hypothetical protein BA864_04820 [Desulfuromonadales bacterium C00003093]|nr:MAG: hypothetical protein BA864_04820 [Desulfuromonadales bacterium C00003093]